MKEISYPQHGKHGIVPKKKKTWETRLTIHNKGMCSGPRNIDLKKNHLFLSLCIRYHRDLPLSFLSPSWHAIHACMLFTTCCFWLKRLLNNQNGRILNKVLTKCVFHFEKTKQ